MTVSFYQRKGSLGWRAGWGQGRAYNNIIQNYLLTLPTLQLTEAQQDQEQTWMKNNPHIRSEYLLDTVPWGLREKRLRPHPFPKHLPELRILGNLMSQASQNVSG